MCNAWVCRGEVISARTKRQLCIRANRTGACRDKPGRPAVPPLRQGWQPASKPLARGSPLYPYYRILVS
eukprot:1521710-Pleurochrysis_carterae.AAC.1